MVRQMVVTIVATHTKLEELSGIGFAYWFISRGTVGSTYIQSVPRFNLHSSADTVQLLGGWVGKKIFYGYLKDA